MNFYVPSSIQRSSNPRALPPVTHGSALQAPERFEEGVM